MKRTLKLLLVMALTFAMVFTSVAFAFADGETAPEPTNGETTPVDDQEGDANVQEPATDPATDPAAQDQVTEPEGQGTDPATDPADPGTDPTDPGTDPVDPGTEPEPQPEPEPEPEPEPVDITGAAVLLPYTYTAYTGEVIESGVTSVTLEDGTVVDPQCYTISYSRAKSPGTATVKVTANADSGYTGETSATFYIIGSVKDLAEKACKRTTITAGWSKYKKTPFTGYKIYIYKKETDKYKLYKTVSKITATSTVLRKLTATKRYSFKIAAYAKDPLTGKNVTGPLSDPVTMKTAPAAPEKETITYLKSKRPRVLIKWKNLGASKSTYYQNQYSTSPSFSSAKTITIKDTKAKSQYIDKLTGGVRYYFRVRAVKEFNNMKATGKWSDYSSVVPSTTGWGWIDGRKYYFISGNPVKGSRYIGGEHYYFDDRTGECHGASYKVWTKLKDEDSDTPYAITISLDYHRVNIFENIDGDWVMKKQWACTTGANELVNDEGMFTPRGSWKVRYKVKTFGDTFSVWYATNFHRAYYLHSILYNHGSMSVVQDGRLGISASHGCIRLATMNAKWIYENCKKGTRVVCNH